MTVRNGKPSDDACRARAWFAEHDPKLILGSFDWCCCVLAVGGMMGRPLRPSEEWGQRWFRQIRRGNEVRNEKKGSRTSPEGDRPVSEVAQLAIALQS